MTTPIAENTVPWPAAEVERYIAEGYWAGVPLGSLLQQVADRTPDAPALVDPTAQGGTGLRLTHAELAERADAAAIATPATWVSRRTTGSSYSCRNGWEFVVLTLACLRAGIVPVMALPAHRRAELAYLATHAEAVAIAVPDVCATSTTRPSATAWPTKCAPSPERTGTSSSPGTASRRAASTCARCARPAEYAKAGRERLDAPARRAPDVAVLPALRRHHRPAQAHRPHPRRLRATTPGAAPRTARSAPTPSTS